MLIKEYFQNLKELFTMAKVFYSYKSCLHLGGLLKVLFCNEVFYRYEILQYLSYPVRKLSFDSLLIRFEVLSSSQNFDDESSPIWQKAHCNILKLALNYCHSKKQMIVLSKLLKQIRNQNCHCLEHFILLTLLTSHLSIFSFQPV